MTEPLSPEEFKQIQARAKMDETYHAPWVARDDRDKLIAEILRLTTPIPIPRRPQNTDYGPPPYDGNEYLLIGDGIHVGMWGEVDYSEFWGHSVMGWDIAGPLMDTIHPEFYLPCPTFVLPDAPPRDEEMVQFEGGSFNDPMVPSLFAPKSALDVV